VLPRVAEALEAWNFYKIALGLNENQVVWTPGVEWCLDNDMTTPIIEQLRFLITAEDLTLCPYTKQASFLRWAEGLLELPNVVALGESPEWTKACGDKGILHRHMVKFEPPSHHLQPTLTKTMHSLTRLAPAQDSLDTPSVIETIDESIPVPRGFVCKHSRAARSP